MAKKVDSLFTKKAKYPFETWADGEVWEVTRGTDFSCTTDEFKVALRAWAFNNKHKTEVTTKGNTVRFTLTHKFNQPTQTT